MAELELCIQLHAKSGVNHDVISILLYYILKEFTVKWQTAIKKRVCILKNIPLNLDTLK